MLFAFRPRPISDLKQSLLKVFSGQQLSMREIYEHHSVDTPYIERNYKLALRQLESEGLIAVDPPANKRRKYQGEVSFGNDVRVTFS